MWLDGYDYRTIREYTGISLGKQSEIVSEARKTNPDIDELRQLNKLVKEKGLAVSSAIKGLSLIADLKALNISEEYAAQAIAQITSYGEEAPKILEEAKTLLNLEKQTGIKYPELAADYRRKAKAITELTEKREALKDECEALESKVLDLKELRTLQEKIQRHNLTIKKLDRFIENNIKLEEIGFTPTIAETLSSELSKQGANPEKAAEIIAESVAKHQTLEKRISEAERRVEQLRGEIEKAEKQLEIRRATLDELNINIEVRKRHLQDMQDAVAFRYAKLELEYEAKRKELESGLDEWKRRIDQKKEELQRLTTQAEEEPKKRKQQLEAEIDQLKKEVQKLREERDTLQKDVISSQAILESIKLERNKIEEDVKKNEPLAKLNALLTNPKASLQRENLEPLIVILKNVVSVSGLGNIWGLGYPRGMLDSPKVRRGEEFIQDLIEEVKK